MGEDNEVAARSSSVVEGEPLQTADVKVEVGDDDDPKKKKIDYTPGAVQDRKCTDCFCTVAWAVHFVMFLTFAAMGLGGGDVAKLYFPRDYKGDYCGLEKQWNDGANHKDYNFVVKTMNVSGTVEKLAKELICSSAAETIIVNGGLTTDQLDKYMCGCCKTPCLSCRAVLATDDYSSGSSAKSAFTDKMGVLTNTQNAAALFSVGGPNGDAFGNIFMDMHRYFNDACVKSCDDVIAAPTRTYTYSMEYDHELRFAWELLKIDAGGIGDTIKTSFTFAALSKDLCNYEEKYCVPFPGITYSDITGAGFCMFQLTGEMTAMFQSDVLGGLTDAYGAGGGESEEGGGTLDPGSMMGAVMETYTSTVIVFVWSFVAGLILLVLIRIFVKPAVWGTILAIHVLTIVSGMTFYIVSGQCSGTSFTDSTKGYAASAQAEGLNQAATYNGGSVGQFVAVDLSNEELTGDGKDYNGLQTLTRSGRKCQKWDSQTPHANTMKTKYDTANLTSNYCRNPNGAIYIWCFTQEADVRWELCNTLNNPAWARQCPDGYKVKDKTSRQALEIIGAVMIVFFFVEFCITWCLRSTIARLIGVIEAAAEFIVQTPHVILVPVIQGAVMFLWISTWMFFAAFIIANVPDGYIPTTYYATYAEAYGTATTAGACNDKWPTGYAWKYGGDALATDDPCSGNLGNVEGITPKCWACTPPRYVFDQYFAYSFFTFLWNNALMIAVGQCVVAGAASSWFFLPNGEKFTGNKMGAAVKNAFFYHFGSLCVGSFIIAVVQFIKWCLYYLEKQSKAQKNRVMELVFKVLGCFVACFERCLEFLSKNAYIQIAITGNGFCISAKNAFFLILRNMPSFGLLVVLGGLISQIGVFCIFCMTVIFGYIILLSLAPHVSPVAPMMIYCCIGYVVGKMYMTVFHLAIDTVLQCAIMQTENQYEGDFIPSSLRKILPGHEPDKE